MTGEPMGGGAFMTTVADEERDLKFRFIRFLIYQLDGLRPAYEKIPLGKGRFFDVLNQFDLTDVVFTTAVDDNADYRPPVNPPQDARAVAMSVKVILNGFPKAGLHLCEQMARLSLKPFLFENWIGSFGENSWSMEWKFVEKAIQFLDLQTMGTFVKGHIGWREDIIEAMERNRTGMVFIFRDLRDVACSIKRHVLQEKGQQWIHPGRVEFVDMGDPEAQLIAVLEGWNEFGGLIERWEQYAPWLETENVLPMPYEFMRLEPEAAYQLFIRYALGQAALPNGILPGLFQNDLDRHTTLTAKYMNDRERSPTYIKGKVGGWREEFTPRVREIFDDLGGSKWLVKLGYEQSEDWQ